MRSIARVGSPSTPAQGSPGKVSAKKHAKNSNIYKVFCKKQAKTAIFTRFSAKTSREIGIRNEDAGFPWPENFESGDAINSATGNLRSRSPVPQTLTKAAIVM